MKDLFYRVATDDIRGPLIGILKLFFLALSFVYTAIVATSVWLYRNGVLKQHRLDRPVISVGNITVGGTGKTPLVIKIAQICKENKLKPAILTRGYMGRGPGSSSRESDEAAMMREVLGDVPVLAGADRVKNAEEFLGNNQADIFILDDGFQHWRLARDLDIVAVDAVNPFGNGQLLPRGILREPLATLRRAGLLVLTRTDMEQAQVGSIRKRLAMIGCAQPIIETIHRPVRLVDLKTGQSRGLGTLAGLDVCAFCSLGAPAAFTATLRQLGAKIQKAFNFVDHYVYNTKDIRSILEFCRPNQTGIVVTTQKDAVKLADLRDEFRQIKDIEFLALYIELAARDGGGEDTFVRRVLDVATTKNGGKSAAQRQP